MMQLNSKLLLSYPSYFLITSLLVFSLGYWAKKSTEPVETIQSGVTYHCKLLRVIDGDSVLLDCDERELEIRLLYIDAPEMGQKPWGRVAKAELQKLLSESPIQLRLFGKDIYQRYLGQIMVKDNDINLQMVERGNARVYVNYKPPHHYQRAMQQAKNNKKGIWRTAGLQQNPQRWRRLAK